MFVEDVVCEFVVVFVFVCMVVGEVVEDVEINVVEDCFVLMVKVICCGECVCVCGVIIIDGSVGCGKLRGCVVCLMMMEFNDAWWSALERDVRKLRELGLYNVGFVGLVLRYVILVLKSY